MDEFEGYQVLDISLQLTTVRQTRVHEGGGGGVGVMHASC